MSIEMLNSWVGFGGLVLEICLAVFVIWYLFAKQSLLDFIKSFTSWRDFWAGDWSQMFLIKVMFLTGVSTLMSLVYSEWYGVTPCGLCWFGRIFMYGSFLLSTLAVYKKEAGLVFPYVTVFAGLGLVVSLYHHFLQMTATLASHLPCPTSGGDCAKRIIFEYGHITFPYLAAIVFALIIFMYLLQKNLNK